VIHVRLKQGVTQRDVIHVPELRVVRDLWIGIVLNQVSRDCLGF
jgi:hypothetical protein